MIVSVQPFVHGTFVLKIESGYKTGQFVSKPKLKDTDIEFPETFGTEASALKWAIETGYQIFKYHDEVNEEQYNKLLNRKCQAEINEELSCSVLDLLKENKRGEALDIIRGIKNPLTAGWVVQEVLGELNLPSRTQTKNWLINALYNGK